MNLSKSGFFVIFSKLQNGFVSIHDTVLYPVSFAVSLSQNIFKSVILIYFNTKNYGYSLL